MTGKNSNLKTVAVILSYNHPGVTKKCVQSVLNFFENKSIVLVHNGSHEEFVSGLKTDFPEIHHLEIKENLGFAGGANAGISWSFKNNASAVAFFSNDTILKQFEFIPTQEKYLAAVTVEMRETGRVHSLGGEVSLLKGELKHLTSPTEERENFYVPGASFLIDKVAWQSLGGFDEGLHSYWEDVDLSLRAKKLGIALVQAPNVIVKHGISKTCGGDPQYTVYYFQRNRKKVALRHLRLMPSLVFRYVYFLSVFRKLFKYALKSDFRRAKLILKAALSC